MRRAKKPEALIDLTAHPPTEAASAPRLEGAGTDVKPFRIQVAAADLEDLRHRLARTRWPGELPGVGTAGSSARLYKETANDLSPASEPSAVPTGVAVSPGELGPSVRRFAEPTHNIVHGSEFDRGGHFPAMEVPDVLVGDLREFFRRFRDANPRLRKDGGGRR